MPPALPAPVDGDFVAFQRALVGEYSLERELGRGGMGIVYLAREVSLDRLVAIKLLPPHLAVRPELRARFLREARTAAKLSHPNIVAIFRVDEAGDAGEFVYFTMAYVEGETLTQRVRARGHLPAHEVSRIVREVAWALAYAHARGIVHRDVKPDNILLESGSGRALVTDFGIAYLAEAAPITGDGLVMGTAQYMSPEQASGEAVDGRSDLYSLAVVAHFALTGQLPFDAATVPALLAKHVSEPAPPVASRAAGVPRELAQAIDRCLAKDPAARFASGEALADAVAAPASGRELPIPVRLWVSKRDPLVPLYAVFTFATTIPGIFTLVASVLNGATLPRGTISVALALIGVGVVIPLVGAAKVRLWNTRRALATGLTLDDLRWGLAEHLRSRREELEFERAQPPALGARLVRAAAYGGLATVAAATVAVVVEPAAAASPLVRGMFQFGALAAVGGGVAGLAFPGRQLSARWHGRVREWFWNSRGGEWATKIAGAWLRPRAPVGAAQRPTELAIGLAVDHLFDALPRATRKQLGDVPAAVRALEREARQVRERIDALDGRLAEMGRDDPVRGSATLAALGGPDASLGAQRTEARRALDEARAAAARRLGTVVAALENIRLDLLRLHAGTEAPASLTALVDVAARVERDVSIALDAKREAEGVVT